jgi:hypothetical protein
LRTVLLDANMLKTKHAVADLWKGFCRCEASGGVRLMGTGIRPGRGGRRFLSSACSSAKMMQSPKMRGKVRSKWFFHFQIAYLPA